MSTDNKLWLFIVVSVGFFCFFLGDFYGPTGTVTEEEFKAHKFLICFYDAIQRNRPFFGDKGQMNTLEPYHLGYLEGVCTGQTGADLRFGKPQYGPFKYPY